MLFIRTQNTSDLSFLAGDLAKIGRGDGRALLGTSQGRVSKLERGLASLDQLTRSWLALGGSTEELGRVLARG